MNTHSVYGNFQYNVWMYTLELSKKQKYKIQKAK